MAYKMDQDDNKQEEYKNKTCSQCSSFSTYQYFNGKSSECSIHWKQVLPHTPACEDYN